MEDGFTTAYILYIQVEKRERVIVEDMQPFLKNKFVSKMSRALLAELLKRR